jgi:hypothetical protein
MAIILIFAIICLNTNKSLFYTPGPFNRWTDYLPFLALTLCAFLCSLLLQAEEILMICSKKKSLFLRWELVVTGALCFLFGLEKYLCLLLIPTSQFANLHFGFAMITEAVFLADNIDIVFMFAAGVLLVRAFHLQDVLIERKRRKNYLLLYVSLILLIVLIGYFKVWVFINIEKFNLNIYIINILNIFYVFIYSLILQAERIIPIFHKGKILQIHWEMIALSIAALFFAIIEIWMEQHLYESPSTIFQSITGSVLWQAAYSFAAGMFFVRAFSVRSCQDEVIQ